jgi:cell division protein FtsI (penicillin-binding protein 3)
VTPPSRPSGDPSGQRRRAAQGSGRTPAPRPAGHGRSGAGRPAERRPAERRPAERRPPAAAVPLGRPATRLGGGLIAVLVLLALIGGRLVYLQGFQAEAYADEAQQQRLRTVMLTAPRGSVTDRSGQALALSVDARAVYGEPRQIAKAVCADEQTPCSPATIAAALAPVLDVPVGEIREKLTRPAGEGKTCSAATVNGCTAFVYLARGLDPAVASEVQALRLVGIGTLTEPKRVRPDGGLAANLLGFTNVDGAGAAGVELGWNDVLAGVNGKSTDEVDSSGRVIPTGRTQRVEPSPGRDVQLTIDRDLQWYAQEVLARRVAEADAESGSAVVMDVKTGEVLALATAPSFDANDPGASPPELRGNPAISDVFEPGSVGKVITAAAALEAGVVTPDTVMSVPDRILLAGKNFKDSHDHPTERMTFTGVLVESSNVGTIMAAQKLGGQKLHDALRRFGLGEKTGMGLPGESRGIVPAFEDWSGTSHGTIPIGQGYSVNGVQMASVYSTIANDGVRVTPSIVRATADEGGSVVPAPAPETERVIAPEIAAQLRTMLEGVTTDEGTAPLAAIPGYRVAGKTGTAQRVVDGRYSGYTASFVGFAPADAPRLAISVSLQDPKNGYYGGAIAAPVFRDIMSFALRSMQVLPTGTPPPVLRLRE